MAPFSVFSDLTQRIDAIQKESFDTVFAFIYVGGQPNFESYVIKGIGKTSIHNRAIVIGIKDNRAKVISLIDTYKDVFVSKPILTSDTSLRFLRNRASSFRFERFLPYVWETYSENDSTVKGFYSNEPGLHEPFQTLYFKDSSESTLREFCFESLNENYLNSNIFPPNLNFKYNTSLKLFDIYAFLNRLSKMYENQFDFAE